MKRRRCVAVLLGSGVVLLSAACGSSPPTAVAPAANGSTLAAASQPSASSPYSQPEDSTRGRQPCSRPATMNGFLKLNSATAAQGGTQVSITIVNCSVDPVNDEDVSYAPVSSTTALITVKAPVQVLTPGNSLRTVSGSWLVGNQVVNTPYFYYQENVDHQITAMQEIYHP
jgi:hypothetical protein